MNIPLTVMGEAAQHPPNCKNHGNVMKFWKNGKTPSGQTFWTDVCECEVDAVEHTNSHTVLHTVIMRMHHENTELRDQLADLKDEA